MSDVATSTLKNVFDRLKLDSAVEAVLRKCRGKETVAAKVVFHNAPTVAEELVHLSLPTFYDPRANALEPDDQGSVVTIGSMLPSTLGGK